MRIGDPVNAYGYQGIVSEFERYGKKGSVCVYLDWDGDMVYSDYEPDQLKPIPFADLSPYMKRESIKRRSKQFLATPKMGGAK